MLQRVNLQRHASLERLSARFTGEWHILRVSDKMLADVCHRVEFLLADLAGEFLFGVAMDDLDVLVEGPKLLKRLVTCDARLFGHITGNLNVLLTVRLKMEG